MGKAAAQSGKSTAADPLPEQSFLWSLAHRWRDQMVSEGELAADDLLALLCLTPFTIGYYGSGRTHAPVLVAETEGEVARMIAEHQRRSYVIANARTWDGTAIDLATLKAEAGREIGPPS